MDPQTFETMIYPSLSSYRTENSSSVPQLSLSKMVVAEKGKSASLLVLDHLLYVLVRQTQPMQREELDPDERINESFPPSKGMMTLSFPSLGSVLMLLTV